MGRSEGGREGGEGIVYLQIDTIQIFHVFIQRNPCTRTCAFFFIWLVFSFFYFFFLLP